MDELTHFLGAGEASHRYFNVRRLIESQKLNIVEFSAASGVALHSCYKLFIQNPTQRISAKKARTVEQAFGLPAFILDREMEASEFPVPPKPEPVSVSHEAVAFLGTGVFLHRFININTYRRTQKLTNTSLFKVPGLTTSAAIIRSLEQFPSLHLSTVTARYFERHFKLKSGSLDEPAPEFDYSVVHGLHVVAFDMLPVFRQGEAINRYVNFRRFMIQQGLTVTDVAAKMDISVTRVSAILSARPVDIIGDRSSRNIEKCFGLEVMSLDSPHTQV
jgi:hypothetical protein